jgi:hypothetical protein
MREGYKEAIAKIIDESSGGIKGLDLLVKLSLDGLISHNSADWDLDELTAFVRKELPEFGVLEYGMALGSDMTRVKYFFYRKLHVCQKG